VLESAGLKLRSFGRFPCLTVAIYDYWRPRKDSWRAILQQYRHFTKSTSGLIGQRALRRPFPAQLSRSWALPNVGSRRDRDGCCRCGTGKTLISLEQFTPQQWNPFTALAMVPPHLVEKWARKRSYLPECACSDRDLPQWRHENNRGVNEVRLQGRSCGKVFTTLSELRLRKVVEFRTLVITLRRPSLFS